MRLRAAAAACRRSAFALASLVAGVSPAAPSVPYARGLGDHQNSVHVYFAFRDNNAQLRTTFEQALDIVRQMSNVSNGTHLVAYGFGWEKHGPLATPLFVEDDQPPFDRGFDRFRELTRAATAHNANFGTYLDSALAGEASAARVPVRHRSFDRRGSWKQPWALHPRFYGISLWNKVYDESADGEWALLRENVNHFGMSFAVFEDALGQVGPPPGYDIRNECATCGGAVTTAAMERAAGAQELDHLWATYGISTMTEFSYPEWIDDPKGGHDGLSRAAMLWGADGVPGALSKNDDYLNVWGNSVVFVHRRNRDAVTGLAWGSENGSDYLTLEAPAAAAVTTTDELRRSFFVNGAVYLYMQTFEPVSYEDTPAALEVRFASGPRTLVSRAAKQGGGYELRESADRQLIWAIDGDRFVPQIGAGLKIFAYTERGSQRSWRLPQSWDGVSAVDRYRLSLSAAPTYLDTLPVNAEHELVLAMAEPDAACVLVAAGDPVTPTTIGFNALASGQPLPRAFRGLASVVGNEPLVVQAPSAEGGFASNSVAFAAERPKLSARFKLPRRAIFHGLRVGVRDGAGSIVLSSSDRRNPDVRVALPEPSRTVLVETNWRFPESGAFSVRLEHEQSVSRVLLNYLSYSAPAPVLSAAEGQDGAIALRVAGTRAARYHVSYGTRPGVYAQALANVAARALVVKNLRRGTRYYFSVYPEGAPDLRSSELSATPLDHTTAYCEDRLSNGEIVTGSYAGLDWGTAPAWRSQAPTGGLTSRSLRLDTPSTSADVTLALPPGQQLSSVRLGSACAGDARVTLSSSEPANPERSFLVNTQNRGQVVDTDWLVSSPTPRLTIRVECASGVGRVGFDDWTYAARPIAH